MNWTGGTLPRSRNAKTSLSVIQKKHFAKARGKLSNVRPSPPSIRFFDFGEWKEGGRTSTVVCPELPRDRGRACTQRTLDEFDNTKHLARQLASLRPRQDVTERKALQFEPKSYYHLPEELKETAQSPIIVSSQPSPAGTSKDNAPVQRDPTPNTRDVYATDSIEAIRRRLLGINDWVGLKRTRPVRMDFEDVNDRDQIGKRRRLSKNDQRMHDTRGTKRLKRTSHAQHDYLSQADISVRIGSAVDRSVPERRSASEQDSHRSSSDEMLLDHEFSRSLEHSPRSADLYSQPQHAPICAPSQRSPRQANTVVPLQRETFALAVCRDSSPLNKNGTDARDELIGEQAVLPPAKSSAERRKVPKTQQPIADRSADNSRHRLVFEQTTCPHTESSEWGGFSPVVRDFGVENVSTPVGANLSTLSPSGHWRHVPQQNENRILYIDHLDLNKSSICEAELKESWDLQIEGIGHSKEDNAAQERALAIESTALNRARSRTGTSQESVREVGQNEEAHQLNLPGQGQPQASSEEELTWRKLLNANINHASQSQPSPIDNTFHPQPSQMTTRKASEINVTLDREETHNTPATPTQDVSSKDNLDPTPEEEEQIWRSFVFGVEDAVNVWSLSGEEEEPSSQSIIATRQPSMIAEVDTSPIKQNPYLVEDKASITSSDSPGTVSMLAEASAMENVYRESSSTSSFLDEATPIFHHTHNQNSSAHLSSSLSERTSPKCKLPTIPSQLARTAYYHPTSSLNVQASTSSSTDELTWSPARFLPRVVFKKPERYVGERSSDLVEPVVYVGRRVEKGWRRKVTGVRNGVVDGDVMEEGVGEVEEIEDY